MKKVVQDLTSGGIDWQREKWQSGLGSKFIHQGEKNAAKYADEVIVLSKGVQDYFKETYTQGIKEKLYGDYADEILTREDFLNYNELYSKRIEEYDRKIMELEAEQQNLQTAPNAYPFLDVYRKYRKLEEITRPMVVELIEKIEVYESNRVEITFRFHDEIADLLEELHQKQMGQHEASA